jgi:hypothetical protein
MKTIFRIAALAALLATSQTAMAQVNQSTKGGQGDTSCLTPSEAETLILAVLPDMLTSLGNQCTAQLPAGSPLTDLKGALQSRYRLAGDAAWPAAKPAIAKIIGIPAESKLMNLFKRQDFAAIAATKMAGALKTDDCDFANRIAGLLDPLPPANVAALLIAFVQRDAERKNKTGSQLTTPEKRGFNICPAG